MVRKQNKELEQIRLYVAQLMNDEQNIHSKLIGDLSRAAGSTIECHKMTELLTRLYDAKIEVLEKVYKEIQGI